MHKAKGFREIALTAALLSFCGCLEADLTSIPVASSDDQQASNKQQKKREQDFSSIKDQTNALTVQNVHGTLGTVNPPHVKLDTGVFVTADLLFVRSSEDNLNFAMEIAPTGSTSGSQVDFKESILEPHFHWEWGGRVGLGYLFDHFDNWDLYLNWTYVHGRGKNSASLPFDPIFSDYPLPKALYPTWGGTQTTGNGGIFVDDANGTGVTSASASWMLNLNVIDLELGRSFYIGSKVVLRPCAGLRGAWIDQDYIARYGSIFTPVIRTPTVLPTKMKAENDYKGLGIRGGFDFLWHFTPHFGFRGLFSGSMLYGFFDVKQDYKSFVVLLDVDSDPIGTAPTTFKTRTSPHRVRCNVEGALGLFWEADFNEQKNHISFGLFYELADWFDQNEMTRPFIDVSPADISASSLTTPLLSDKVRNSGDLTYSGVSFKMRFDF